MRPDLKPDLLAKDVYFDNDAHVKVANAVNMVLQTAQAAYGPLSSNAMLEQNWPVGKPKFSHDGVTNLKKLASKDRAENTTIKALVQASEKNNASVGDGTTAAAMLACHFYLEARKLIAAGHHRMHVARMVEETAEKAIEYVDSVKKDLSEDDLLNVARVSCSDDAIAELLTNTVKEVGSEGGITVEEHSGLGVYAEAIEGFYMRKGFTDVRLLKDGGTLSSDFERVPILLLEKMVTDAKEMAAIINKVKGAGHDEVLILGDVMHDALEFLVRQRSGNIIIPTLAGIPATSGMKSIVLDDLAVLTGGRVYRSGENANNFTVEYLGAAERAVVDELSTTVIGGGGDQEEIKRRLGELEKQLADEHHPTTVNALKDRISRLKGKIGLVKVGAATDPEREELRLRIDDAVCALQAARRDGVIPGGGTTLARVKGTPFDHVLQELFKALLNNAGENAELKLGKMLEKEIGYGYDLKNPTDEPIDLWKAGILDPALVIKEVVRNAASVSKELIRTGVVIVYADDIVDLMKASS
jgi:chaperonin GroEL